MSKPVYPTFSIAQLTANKASKDVLNADRFGAYMMGNPHLEVPHGHSFYHMLYFTKGKGEHVIDFVKFPVKPGMIYFMRPGQIHQWRFSGPIDGYIVNFSPTFFDELSISTGIIDHMNIFGADVSAHVMLLDVKTRATVISLFEKILAEQAAGQESSLLMIASLIIELLVTVERKAPKETHHDKSGSHSAIMHDFTTLLEKNFTRLKLPKEYAALLNITPAQLNTICKETGGKPAGEVIRERLLLEAKRMLINFNLSIGEIAGRLNFPDHSYFVKFFRKYTDTTPEAFRKNHYK